MWLSPDMLISHWRCSHLNRTRWRIWRRSNRFSWGMASFPFWCNGKRRIKRRNWWRKNNGPWHQRRQVRLWFSFSVYFPCNILFSILYPILWELPQKYNIGNGKYVFLCVSLTPSTRGIYSLQKKIHCGRRVPLHKNHLWYGWYAPMAWWTPHKISPIVENKDWNK